MNDGMGTTVDRIDCVVVGAGIVGVAVARALALSGLEVAIVEANARIGEEASGRSNEVVHAGFLYEADSLKETLCLRGRALLQAYCAQRGIAHRRVGKLLPATNGEELDTLRRLQARARAIGIDDVVFLDSGQVRELEPAIDVEAALFSPSSGIVDSHALLVSLLGDATGRGAMLAPKTRAIACEATDAGRFVLDLHSKAEGAHRIACDRLVNAAGLGAVALARTMKTCPSALLPTVHLAQGSLFAWQGKAPFRRLVMPVESTLGEGGAFTLDLDGRGRFGPRLTWLPLPDYRVDEALAPKIAEVVRRYWRGVDAGRLAPAYAGIQPRVFDPSEGPVDWVVQGPADHGIGGLVHLFGIDTPGITGSLALAEYVAGLLTGCRVGTFGGATATAPVPERDRGFPSPVRS